MPTDTLELKISTTATQNLKAGQCIKSSERPIIGSKGLLWHIRIESCDTWYDYFRSFVCVSKAEELRAVGTVEVGPKIPFTRAFDASIKGSLNVIDGYFHSSLGENGFIRIDITFTNFKSDIYTSGIVDDFITNTSHYATDVTILIGDKSLEVHRYMLFMISPVFQAEFEHDTEEAKTGKIKITDFEFATVKNVVDYCYGRECEAKTTLDLVNMLRFADKYDIRTIIKSIEPLLSRNLSIDSFCPIAQYAWDCERKDLQSKCALCYKENIASIGLSQSFINMNPSTQVGIIHALGPLCNAKLDNDLKQNEQTYSLIDADKPTVLSFTTDSDHYPTDARIIVGEQTINIHRQYLSMISPVFNEKFNGDTREKRTGAIEIADFDFSTVKLVIDYCYGRQVTDEVLSNASDILRFGHTYKIQHVIKQVEPLFLADLTTDNFCSIVQYAWKYEKSDLKEQCTAFFRKNYDKILFLPDFANIEPLLAMDIIRLAASVKE
uniref:BTB domain-containing protein n=1 Tax=Panagrellus redivivus TaxID=6233 RepID=A0A7E4VIF9_PANRE